MEVTEREGERELDGWMDGRIGGWMERCRAGAYKWEGQVIERRF